MQRLPHLVGDQRSRELTYTGRNFDGDEAQRYGLVLESFATAEEMMAHVQAVARDIAAKSPTTVRGIKRVALHTRDHPTQDSLEHVALCSSGLGFGADNEEAMAAMMEKRRPVFRGD
jgi:enoyl-CoA hydratase